MAPERRFHTFNDDLRARFGDRVQRVTLGSGLVCPHPEGPERCPWCLEASRIDPEYGRGFPAHEQIRRGINFSRRKGTASPLLFVTIRNPRGTCAPADHLKATIEAATAQDGVVVVAFSAPPECVTDDILSTLRQFRGESRELWIEFDSLPEKWPVPRDPDVRFGVTVSLSEVRAAGDAPGEAVHEVADDDRLVERLTALSPDAVGFIPPVILDGTVAAESYENGDLPDPELDTFAARVASLLERLPRNMAVHPVVMTEKSDQVLGPRWALNRQKVQQAIGDSLEKRGSAQGERAGG